MQRRYSLKRSDNYPKTGDVTDLLDGSGTLTVETGFPVTSAIVSHATVISSSAMRIVRKEVVEQDLEGGGSSNALNLVLSPTNNVIVHSMGLSFSRGTMLRQYELSHTIDGITTQLDYSASATGQLRIFRRSCK